MILLASPSTAVARRWREALVGAYPIYQANDRKQLVLALRDYKPTVVFLDHSEKHFGPTALLCRIIRSAPASRFVILARTTSAVEAVSFIKAGARGYARQSIGTTLLCKAARLVASGEIWLGRREITALIDELTKTIFAAHPTAVVATHSGAGEKQLTALSPRERQIASMIARGEHNKEISNHLQITERTVKAHLTSIFRKLEIESRTQLAVLAKPVAETPHYPAH